MQVPDKINTSSKYYVSLYYVTYKYDTRNIFRRSRLSVRSTAERLAAV